MEKKLQEVCKELGVSRRTIQGYEKKGLIHSSSKNKYGHLYYDEPTIGRIRLIHMLQELDCRLNEIGEILEATPEEQASLLIRRLENKELDLQNLKQEVQAYLENL